MQRITDEQREEANRDVEFLRKRLKKTGMSMRVICDYSGTGRPWLKALLDRHITIPNPDKLGKLHDWLDMMEDMKGK
jgi:transcriptional regulator with XRE-family HTH domain